MFNEGDRDKDMNRIWIYCDKLDIYSRPFMMIRDFKNYTMYNFNMVVREDIFCGDLL